MRVNKFIPIILVCLAFLSLNCAVADTVCLKSVLKKGKIRNKVRLVAGDASCPRGFTQIVSSSLPGLQGPQGPQGATGPQGPQGDAANVDRQDFVFVADETADKTSTDTKQLYITCPSGTELLSCNGGVESGIGVPASVPVAFSYAGINRLGDCYFRAYETTATSTSWGIFGYATCVPE
jgi:hypothetical protein